MNNKQFTVELRIGLRRAKEQFLKQNEFQLACKYDNLERAHLKSLQDFVIKYYYMTDKEVNRMLRLNPSTLTFLNNCIDIEPMLASKLRDEDVLDVHEGLYIKRRILKLKKQNEMSK